MVRKTATKTKMTKTKTSSKQAKKQAVNRKTKTAKAATRKLTTRKQAVKSKQGVKGKQAVTRKPAVKRKPASKRKPVSKKRVIKKAVVKKATAKRPASKKQTAKKQAPKKVLKKTARPSVKKTPSKPRATAKPKKTTSRKPAQAKKPISKSPIRKQAAKQPTAKKAKAATRNSAKGFRVNEYIVYPSHGVGQIIEIAEQEIQGQSLDLFVVNFEREKMVLRVPIAKATQTNRMRKLADKTMLANAMKTLRGRARIKRTMWSRRAQEYEAKINSGDLIAIAEVVRDLYRNDTQPEQSYSERQLYEAALDRMAREVAVIHKISEAETILQLEDVLYQATIKAVPKPAEKIEEKIEENAAQEKL